MAISTLFSGYLNALQWLSQRGSVATLTMLGVTINTVLNLRQYTGNRGSSDKYRGQPILVEQHSTMAQYSSNLDVVLK